MEEKSRVECVAPLPSAPWHMHTGVAPCGIVWDMYRLFGGSSQIISWLTTFKRIDQIALTINIRSCALLARFGQGCSKKGVRLAE